MNLHTNRFCFDFCCARNVYVSTHPMEGITRTLPTNRGHRVLHRVPPLFSSSIIANGVFYLACAPNFVVLGQPQFIIYRRYRVRTIFVV